jgi:hypothetical protein
VCDTGSSCGDKFLNYVHDEISGRKAIASYYLCHKILSSFLLPKAVKINIFSISQ